MALIPHSFTGRKPVDEMSQELEAAEARYAAAQCGAEFRSPAEAMAYCQSLDRWNATGSGHPDGDDTPPPAAPAFPHIPTWSDDYLIMAVTLADRREPGMCLEAVGNVPDRHNTFLAEVTAEILRRLDASTARPAEAA